MNSYHIIFHRKTYWSAMKTWGVTFVLKFIGVQQSAVESPIQSSKVDDWCKCCDCFDWIDVSADRKMQCWLRKLRISLELATIQLRTVLSKMLWTELFRLATQNKHRRDWFREWRFGSSTLSRRNDVSIISLLAFWSSHNQISDTDDKFPPNVNCVCWKILFTLPPMKCLIFFASLSLYDGTDI